MKAPFRIRPKTDRDELAVNADPAVLDEFYVRLLGPGGDKVLPEDIKWLAVTHKTFDAGRRGFNERLAFFGRKIVELEGTLALLDSPKPKGWESMKSRTDDYGRKPFMHPQTVPALLVSTEAKKQMMDVKRLAQLAEKYGAREVVRWSPRLVCVLDVDKLRHERLTLV